MRLFIFPLFLILSACNISEETNIPDAKSKAKETINAIMDNWHSAAAEADLKNYIGAMDSGAVYIGTDATENWRREEGP